MDLARWMEIKRLLQEALDLPPEDRQAHLAAVADDDLRQEAEALLSVSTARADLLDHYRVLPPRDSEIPLRSGDRIESYIVLHSLGHGGMSAVYLAEDAKNDRLVALKLLSSRNSRMATSEHKLLARLSHPNIATLFDSGTTETGLRYVAMEYVKGTPITTYCEEHCSTLRSRLELFQKVCAAVAYAHQHLIVHRDLKPSNILVTEAGEPKLLDFGIAKLLSPGTSDVTLTRLEERPLTVAFASPEQLGGEHTATATDIYSLGVLLTFLLTGRLPYKVKSTYDLPWAIRNLEPEKPSTLVPLEEPSAAEGTNSRLPRGPALPEENPRRLRRRLQGDLDAIVLRTLRKEPDRRYRTIAEFSEDIRRYLASEPVSARRGTRRYRATKFIERHRYGVFGGTVALAVLCAFAVILGFQQRETIRERDKARREAERAAAVAAFLVDMFKVSNPLTGSGRTVTAHEILDNAVDQINAAPPATSEVRGTLLHSLGKIYFNLGLYTSAETLLTPALTNLSVSGDRTLITETLTDLARVHYHQGRYREAEQTILKTRAAEQYLGREDRYQKAERESLLGDIAFTYGDFLKAERLFREVLTLRTSAYGNYHPAVAGAVSDLACALHEQGRLGEAATLHEYALTIRRKLYAENHADVVQSIHNLARLEEDRGNLPAARDLYQLLSHAEGTLGSYDLTMARICQGRGSLLIAREEYGRAALEFSESLLIRRRLLPDNHPDIARSLAELGRLAHILKRYSEAEFAYRDSIERLDWVLGQNYPDRIAVANNLAALLAEQKRTDEAEALWRDLLRRSALRTLRPTIGHALRRNLTTLLHEKHRLGRGGTYNLLDVSTLDLAEPSPLAPHRKFVERRTTGAPQKVVIFFDDFDDGRIDRTKWEYGSSVVEQGGELRVRVAVQDRPGWARTRPFAIDPKRPLTISRRAKVYAANQYFDGTMYIDVTGYPERRFGISYAKYSYTGDGNSAVRGFSLFRRDSNPHTFAGRQTNVSKLLAPIWGAWFEEELIYDPRNGEVSYALNGTEHLVYNVGPLPPNASSMTISFGTWGWYTGHYHYVDRLVVRQ